MISAGMSIFNKPPFRDPDLNLLIQTKLWSALVRLKYSQEYPISGLQSRYAVEYNAKYVNITEIE